VVTTEDFSVFRNEITSKFRKGFVVITMFYNKIIQFLSILGFQEIVLQKLEEVAADLRDIKRQNREFFALSSSPTSTDCHKYPPLPLQTSEELSAAEECIADIVQFNKLVRCRKILHI
jgi:hypothetical protein